MKGKHKPATPQAESEPEGGAFVQTVRRMLATPPKPHASGKAKGAAPKRDPRSCAEGSKGLLGGGPSSPDPKSDGLNR
jgi:hypothetical protein